jgi:hypothetical protein
LPSTVIEEPLFTEQINSLRIEWKRLDEAFMTLEPAILNVPDVFPVVPGTILHRVKIVGFKDVPPLSIYFAIRGTLLIWLLPSLSSMTRMFWRYDSYMKHPPTDPQFIKFTGAMRNILRVSKAELQQGAPS